MPRSGYPFTAILRASGIRRVEGPGTIDPSSPSSRSFSIALVGAGRVATALGVALQRAGHPVVGASGRAASRDRVSRYLPGTPFVAAAQAARGADVVIVGVVDDAIAWACMDLATSEAVGPGTLVVHLSGSMGLDTLDPAADRGADVMSLHPLQSFPDVDEGLRRLPGSGIALTARTGPGYAAGLVLARAVGGRPFRLADEVKPLYHAAAVFGANYLVVVEAVAERLMVDAGVADPLPLLAPLVATAHDRTFALGPAAALTGPAVRGDTGTILRNLRALQMHAPEVVASYVALASLAAGIAVSAGRLSEEGRDLVEQELERWR